MKEKVTFEVRVDAELYRKAVAAATHEKQTLNNYMLHLIRTNVAYLERTHGKMDTSGISLPGEE